METFNRMCQLNKMMAQASEETLIVTNILNIRYLTGFTGSTAFLVVRSAGGDSPDALFCTDGRYIEQAETQLSTSGFRGEISVGNNKEQLETAARFLGSNSAVSIEAESTSIAAAQRWSSALGVNVMPALTKIEALRRFKDKSELEMLSRACQIADQALAAAVAVLTEEPSETELAAELEFRMRVLGAEGPSFETIVASGPNSAMPHARPSERTIREGDAVVVDFGAIWSGYHSDCTRTFFLGSPPLDFQRAYSAVERAQSEGIRRAGLNTEIASIDQACRDALGAEGLAEFFTHGTGHGVGLEVHELPWISSGTQDTLGKGDAFTVEPGIYFRSKFGIRIEDTLAITQAGTEQLTQAPKAPIIT